MKVAAIVPSLNPDETFRQVIEDLIAAGFARIYVVNDGSAETSRPLFDAAAAHPQVTLLQHEVNHGKGYALKTAMERYLKDNNEGYIGVVTLDGDGQHSAEDVLKIVRAMQAAPDALVLGARDFSQSHVPTKSAWGNKITRGVFRLACGIPITDTQTGLRGIPNNFAAGLLDVPGERYEFETNMLLETKTQRVPVVEVPISTIYIDNNSASHFRPLVDSFRIYALILKYIATALTSFLIDYLLFALLEKWLLAGIEPALRLLLATGIARVCSSLYNFFMNKSVVFASRENTGRAMARYYTLAVAQLLCSYGGIYLLSQVLGVPSLLAKLLVDGALFCISFFIQRKWVFKSTV